MEKKINTKNQPKGAYFIYLQMGVIKFQIDEEVKIVFQKYFWENEGKEGGGPVIKWNNEELFNKK